MQKAFYFIIVLTLLAGCSSDELDSDRYSGLTYCAYTESDDVILNPERGFTIGRNWYSPQDPLITQDYITLQRKIGRTLLYTGYYLTDYMESDIPQAYLDMIDANMRALRAGGMKCILRFAYKTDMYETGHPWDASPQWVHRHIQQLKPILQRNGDVIFVLQAGFIGVWGEWAFTDHFVSNPKTPEEHKLRKEVMVALLDAMPKDRQIAVRTPMFKRKMFLESYSDSLTIETAYSGSDLSRICGHNDCFGADASDMGTFLEKGTRDFWKKETRYVLMGGETCQVSKFCECDVSIKDMEEYHWTYLSGTYHGQVLKRWRTDGCYSEVDRRLGYRLSLKGVHHSVNPVAGKDFRIVIELQNTGFAAPMNPRGVELVFQDGNSKKTVYRLDDVIDPRYWFAGEEFFIDRTVTLPEDATGDCIMYLNLPDCSHSLRNKPFFSIRLANDNVWDEKTGYNKVAEFKL